MEIDPDDWGATERHLAARTGCTREEAARVVVWYVARAGLARDFQRIRRLLIRARRAERRRETVRVAS